MGVSEAYENRRRQSKYVSAYLSRYGRDKRITMRMVGELVGIIEPDIPMRTVIRIVGTVLYVIWFLVYIEKRSVNLPNIGRFYATWREPYEREVTDYKGDKIKTIYRSKWSFRFQTRLMGKENYLKFMEEHKRTAMDYLGIEHPDTAAKISQDFYRAYRKKYGLEHNEVVWTEYLKEWLPYKAQRRAEDLLALHSSLDGSCAKYLDTPPEDSVK